MVKWDKGKEFGCNDEMCGRYTSYMDIKWCAMVAGRLERNNRFINIT